MRSASGFVYRGKAIPSLRGKFLFGDITTGRVWWADFKEMLAADDGDPKTMAEMHEVKIAWNKEVYRHDGADQRDRLSRAGRQGGASARRGRVPGGRSDIRFAMDADRELYIMTKSDGVIRAVVGAVTN